jgi:hypothetical protein
MTEISFLHEYNFDDRSIRFTQGAVGIYFIYLLDAIIGYPFGASRLIYLGLSESKQNSIGQRLSAHLSGRSGNACIKNYVARNEVRFTFHTFELLRNLGTEDLYEIESFFLRDFLRAKGAFPICNNQSGMKIREPSISDASIKVEWEHFS